MGVFPVQETSSTTMQPYQNLPGGQGQRYGGVSQHHQHQRPGMQQLPGLLVELAELCCSRSLKGQKKRVWWLRLAGAVTEVASGTADTDSRFDTVVVSM
jgi:hypothetical protein